MNKQEQDSKYKGIVINIDERTREQIAKYHENLRQKYIRLK